MPAAPDPTCPRRALVVPPSLPLVLFTTGGTEIDRGAALPNSIGVGGCHPMHRAGGDAALDPRQQGCIDINDANNGPPSSTASGRERGRGREEDGEDQATLERWRMMRAAARGFRRGNATAMAIITLVNSKILASLRFEYRPLVVSQVTVEKG
jgi:hypothetical protein